MSKRAKVFAVVPAYNEESRISKAIKDLKKYKYNVVVVDDASVDNTVKVVKKFRNIVLVEQKVNQGQGAALRVGIKRALKEGADIIVTFDGDGQHQAKEINELIAPIEAGVSDISLGSRFLGKKTDMPLSRKILLGGSVWVERIFFGIKLSDAHNGFRAMSRSAAKKIRINEDRMAHASEIIKEISRNGLRYNEVPVKIIYNKDTIENGTGSYRTAIGVLFKIVGWRFFG
ncbi:MAG: glycosyltransferase family 2 protein [Candidatus Nanoarchaeia archaeon]|jgi:glycosyltransferase involved in cell wall biosynthesis|nr:glycosyltransferase family 2 protein [Candidatus Nanoarchaeia archaeon]|tara:strand:+ start:290 stop:979 length:690 start_codon:yes stop_codon:yes gene_type:complete